MKKDMRIAALPIALLSIVVGVVGIASPELGMTIRRLYFGTPSLAYAVIAVHSATGLGLILAASSSPWPRTLRALGAVVCLQGLSGTLLGLDRARAVMEWEGMQGSALLRIGAAVALASGSFIVFAVRQRPSEQRIQLTSNNRRPLAFSPAGLLGWIFRTRQGATRKMRSRLDGLFLES